MIDVDEMRTPVLAMNRLTGVDAPWTLYYDETNNIRRLRVSDTGFNVAEPACFVLGGIVHAGPPRDLDLIGLRDAVAGQPRGRIRSIVRMSWAFAVLTCNC